MLTSAWEPQRTTLRPAYLNTALFKSGVPTEKKPSHWAPKGDDGTGKRPDRDRSARPGGAGQGVGEGPPPGTPRSTAA